MRVEMDKGDASRRGVCDGWWERMEVGDRERGVLDAREEQRGERSDGQCG